MANSVQDKNKSISVKGMILPSGATNGTAQVSVSGSDPGKILGVKNGSGNFLKYTDAVTVGNNATNITKINSALSVAPASVSSVNGVVSEAQYNISTSQTPTGQPQNTRNEIPASSFDPKSFLSSSGTNLTGKVFVVPRDMKYEGNGAQDHIRIRALKYKPPQGSFADSGIGDIGAAIKQSGIGDVLTKGLSSANANLPPPDYQYEGEIILPIPSEVRDRTSASWGKTTMPLLSAAASSVVTPIAQNVLQGDILGALGSGAGAVTETLDIFKSSTGDARSVIAASISASLIQQKLGLNVEPSDILARTTGKVANPNMELLFRGPDMRDFTFSWKFVPRDESEGKELRRLIKFMKLNTLPSLSGNGILINSPNVFFIRYMNGDSRIKSLPQPKICACTAFGIDHSEDGQGWAAFEDSQPVATRLSMNFLELTPLFRDEMESAFPADDDVGY